MNPTNKETPGALIIRAFERARASGKPEWFRMTTAVMKNRLLELTGNEFSEQAYGVSNIREFLALAPDTVRLTYSGGQLFVELLEGSRPAAGPPEDRQSRIRPDLWLAVMDYSSGRRYVWDPQEQSARPQVAESDASLRELPTIRTHFARPGRAPGE